MVGGQGKYLREGLWSTARSHPQPNPTHGLEKNLHPSTNSCPNASVLLLVGLARIQPHIFASLKSVGMKKGGAGVGGKKRKRAFLGSPQVEIASGCALGGRRGLARPAIEPPLPMPQAINRHKGCLSDESWICFFLLQCILCIVHWISDKQNTVISASQPARGHSPPTSRMARGNPQPQASWRSQPPPSLGTASARPACHWIQRFPRNWGF